ncbi:myogenesis-regulating glycosidase-like [Saccoglossus kowalevskii]|uniref:Uncharacterized family 31 glucosidase KIAA1161-like n=1 Tax=Saccoglossus kowalevskii TaxID=10224 RepID=A0ABM0GYX1_SACKO|nr:PREDICTED: uncharacterized family 31 glucosidase KIAA1161-like [Saccoglossus kowalevskii]
MINNLTETTLVSKDTPECRVKFDVVSVDTDSDDDINQDSSETPSLPKTNKTVNTDVDAKNSFSDIDYGLPIKRLKQPREIKLKLFVFFLFVLIVIIVTLIWVFHVPKLLTLTLGNAKIIVDYGELYVSYHGKTVLQGRLGINQPQSPPYSCHGNAESDDRVCLSWKNHVELNTSFYQQDLTDCYEILWTSLSKDYVPRDCFSLAGAYWYGGGDIYGQQWPINNLNFSTSQFLSTTDLKHNTRGFGSVLEPYWLSSLGVAIYVDDVSSLHVSINDSMSGEICFESKYENSMYIVPEDKLATLKYKLCVNSNVKTTHQYISKHYLGSPITLSNEFLLESPVWSTSPYYHTINQSIILDYAEKIDAYNFSKSLLVIDDGYLWRYGDTEFDPVAFPNPTDMCNQLHNTGFNVSVWMHPFANTNSHAFSEGLRPGYWVHSPRDNSPALIQWWNGIAASLLDVTSPSAVEWFLKRMNEMRETYNIDSFLFAGGEVSWLPVEFSTHRKLLTPTGYTTLYSMLAAQLGRNVMITSAYHSQTLALFLSMKEKESSWDTTSGLQSVIPTVLTYNILGYPFIMPEVIGGRENQTFADRELYIRWLELTAFLPVMHFSLPPWEYDQEVVDIATKWVQFHRDVIAPIMIDLADNFLRSTDPIIRPLWWASPTDGTAQQIDSEFLIGDDIVVAPILEFGRYTRDVYLPDGMWVNKLTGQHITGGKWLTVVVTLENVAYFTRVS